MRWINLRGLMISERPRLVAFDVFGTLLQIGDKRDPYRQLFQALGVNAVQAARRAMTIDTGLAELAELLEPGHGLDVEPFNRDLAAEIDSVAMYPDAIDLLSNLRSQRIRVASISNLASPYIEPAERLLSEWIEHRIYSCRAGVLKPDAKIFHLLCETASVAPADVLMIGDSYRCDVAGPWAFGIRAIHLQRNGEGQNAVPGVIHSMAELRQII